MQYREDKRSGQQLSALGLGCMRLPMKVGGIDVDATEQLVLRALELGVNYFDTAYLYPGSEEALGTVIARNGLRDRMMLATKLPHGKCHKAEDAERLFATSLARLQTDRIDYYLIHNMVSFDQWQRLVDLGLEDWIAQKKATGAIRQIGFSFHGSFSEFERVLQAYDWDFVQIQYNYVNEHYQAGREGMMMAAERGLPVIIMEPLLGGKLVNGLPASGRKAMEEANSLHGEDRSAAEWALRWLWDQPQVTVVLSGMGALDQLEDNCAAASTAQPGCLDEGEHAIIESVREEFQRSFRVPCTGCNYCMPCPQGISIPACFASYNESFTLGWFTGVEHYLITVGAGTAKPHLVSDCVECGACAKKCPQHIDIPAELRAVGKRLQFPGMKVGLKVAGKIMGR